MLIEKSPFVHIFKTNGVVCLYHSLYITNIYGSHLLAELFEALRFPQTIEQAARHVYSTVGADLGNRESRIANRESQIANLKSRIANLESQITNPHACSDVGADLCVCPPDKETAGSRQDAESPCELNQAIAYIELLLKHKFLRYLDSRDEANLVLTMQQQAQCSSPQFLYLVPTSVCNLRCKYCHIIDTWAAYGHHHMSTETAEAGINKFMEHSTDSCQKEIMFYGGEPLLNPDVVKHAVSYIRKNDTNGVCKITMFTNATVITREMAEFLANNDVFVIVSMDGPAEIHDQMRCYANGQGGFEDTAKGYDTCKDAGCRLGISMVLGRHNIPGLKEAVEYLINRFDPIDLGFSTLHLHQHGDNPAFVDIRLLTEEMIDTFRFIREKGVYAEHLFRRIRPFVEQQLRLKDCPSCGGKFLVTPDKSIGFCEAFLGTGHYYYPLESFDLSNEGYNEWKGISPVRREECLRCPSIAICGGGCPYDAWVQHGSINSLDTIRCQQSNILLEWLIWDLFDQIKGEIKEPLDIVIPEPAQRQRIYSNVNTTDEKLPLNSYSKYGEGA
ncbi:MAG: radical SAM protein [bacterium]